MRLAAVAQPPERRLARAAARAGGTLLAALLLCGAAPLAGGALAEEPVYPAYQGYVTDTAGLLQPEERARLEALSGELQRKTTAQLAVATVATTAPLSIDEYAVALFTRWGIGHAERDNGVLLLVARDDRQVWIEVGYGLEGAVPDAIAHRIVRETLVPSFRAGEFGAGILAACGELAGIVAGESGVTLESPGAVNPATRASGGRRAAPLGALLALLFIFLVLGRRGGLLWLLLFGVPRGGGYRGGGGFGGFGGGWGGGSGGGFGGFGGGATGGGGAGGGW